MDGSGFHRTMKRAQSAVKGFGARMKAALGPAGMMGLAAGAAYAMKRLIGDTIDWGTRIRDLGKMYGLSTKFLQEMEYSATQTGLDLEKMVKAFRKMTLKQDIFNNPLTTATTAEVLADSFQKLGISQQQLKTLKPQELFLQIARNMKHVSGNTAGVQDALNVAFGKGGSELLNTFANDIDAMTERFRTLGATVEDDVIQRLGATGDKMEELKQRSKGWAGDAAGHIMHFVDHIDIMGRALGDFMHDRSSAKGVIKTLLGGPSNMLDMATFYETAKQEKDSETAKKKSADMAAKKAEADRRMAAEARREAQESANEMQRRQAEAEAKRQATWGGRGGDNLEKIGGRLGMATTQLNISQQQLAIMIKAQKVREAQNATVQKLNNLMQS